MSWEFRRASVADLDAIMALEASTFTDDAWSTESMRHELASEHGYYLVVVPLETPATIAGYAGIFAPDRAGTADLQTIAVVPEARRHGIGRALVLALVAEARRRGATEMFLEVRADNPGAWALYASLGFEDIAVRPGYYQPGNVDAIVMRLAIGPAETRVATETTVATGAENGQRFGAAPRASADPPDPNESGGETA